MSVRLLDPRTIRELAAEVGLRPSKARGQNFVHDANTVRRIVAAAGLTPGERVVEVGPGLGSLTLGLLEAGAFVIAVEVESVLAARLPRTVAERAPDATDRLVVLEGDALRLERAQYGSGMFVRGVAGQGQTPAADHRHAVPLFGRRDAGQRRFESASSACGCDERRPNPFGTSEATEQPDRPSVHADRRRTGSCDDARDVPHVPGLPEALVANLPYNVSVPVILRLLEQFPSIRHGLVMVQAEVADRLVAPPGSRTYGAPSAKLAWYGEATKAGAVPPSVFWPVPNVDSKLVAFVRRDPPSTTASREAVFAVIDLAFATRRKMLRSGLAGLFGSSSAASEALLAAGVDPQARGETLGIEQFARIAEASSPERSDVHGEGKAVTQESGGAGLVPHSHDGRTGGVQGDEEETGQACPQLPKISQIGSSEATGGKLVRFEEDVDG